MKNGDGFRAVSGALREHEVVFRKKEWPRVRVELLLELGISAKDLRKEFHPATIHQVESGLYYGIMLVSKGSNNARPMYWRSYK